MDLNKKSGIIRFFTTTIEENAFSDIQNFIVLKYFQPAKKYFDRIDGTWLIHLKYLTTIFWLSVVNLKSEYLVSSKFHQSSYKVNFRCKVLPQSWEICASH